MIFYFYKVQMPFIESASKAQPNIFSSGNPISWGGELKKH